MAYTEIIVTANLILSLAELIALIGLTNVLKRLGDFSNDLNGVMGNLLPKGVEDGKG